MSNNVHFRALLRVSSVIVTYGVSYVSEASPASS